MWNDLPYTVFDTGTPWTGLRVQSTIGCFPELCFDQFSVAQVIVGLAAKTIYKHFVFFPFGSVLLVLIIIIEISLFYEIYCKGSGKTVFRVWIIY